MNEIVIAIPKDQEVQIEKESTDILSRVNSLVIRTVEDENLMLSFMLMAKKNIKNIKNVILKDLKKSSKKVYTDYQKLESNLISPFHEIAYNGDAKLKVWLDEKETKRIADQKILDDKAEVERKKEEERVLKCQDKAEAKGKVSTATERHIPQVTIEKKVATQKGASYTDKWYAEVTDPVAVLKQVLDGKLPMSTIEIKMPILNGLARVTKAESTYPGIVFKKTQTISQR